MDRDYQSLNQTPGKIDLEKLHSKMVHKSGATCVCMHAGRPAMETAGHTVNRGWIPQVGGKYWFITSRVPFVPEL